SRYCRPPGFFFSSRRRHTRFSRDWSSDVCSSDLYREIIMTRATISVGEDIGFLPGTEEEKMAPWMGALTDNLEVLLPSSSKDGRSEERRVGKECRERGRRDRWTEQVRQGAAGHAR